MTDETDEKEDCDCDQQPETEIELRSYDLEVRIESKQDAEEMMKIASEEMERMQKMALRGQLIEIEERGLEIISL